METQRTLRWTGVYTFLWLLATIVGLGIVAVGVALGGLRIVGMYQYTPGALRVAFVPAAGAAVILVGIVIWQFGATAALLATLTGSIEDELMDRLNTEAMKSDILSVLDDRLADIQRETERTRQQVDRMGPDEASSEFEFDD